MNSPHTPLPSTPFPRPPLSHLPPPIASPPLYSPIYFHSPLHPPPLSLLSVILFLFFFLPLVPHSTYHFLFSPFARSYFSIISPTLHKWVLIHIFFIFFLLFLLLLSLPPLVPPCSILFLLLQSPLLSYLSPHLPTPTFFLLSSFSSFYSLFPPPPSLSS